MAPTAAYPSTPKGQCTMTQAAQIWSVAAALRRQIGTLPGVVDLARACPSIAVNGRPIEIAWDLDHAVHDDTGQAVLGVCETDADAAGAAYVSINGSLLKNRPDLMLSTAAHELGHVVFDVPAALAQPLPGRRFRSYTASSSALLRAESRSEWRANEFMGAFLAPPFELHKSLLRHARAEDMKLARAPNLGRPAWPVVCGRNDPDALSGVVAVLAQDFGVSPRFVEVRLRVYGLVANVSNGAFS